MDSQTTWAHIPVVIYKFLQIYIFVADHFQRLLPVLEVLDLSHNALVTTDIYLEVRDTTFILHAV